MAKKKEKQKKRKRKPASVCRGVRMEQRVFGFINAEAKRDRKSFNSVASRYLTSAVDAAHNEQINQANGDATETV